MARIVGDLECVEFGVTGLAREPVKRDAAAAERPQIGDIWPLNWTGLECKCTWVSWCANVDGITFGVIAAVVDCDCDCGGAGDECTGAAPAGHSGIRTLSRITLKDWRLGMWEIAECAVVWMFFNNASTLPDCPFYSEVCNKCNKKKCAVRIRAMQETRPAEIVVSIGWHCNSWRVWKMMRSQLNWNWLPFKVKVNFKLNESNAFQPESDSCVIIFVRK